MRMRILYQATVVALAAAGTAAWAQTGPVRPAYAFPNLQAASGVAVPSTPFFAAPYATLTLGNDSNITQAPVNEIDSSFQLYRVGTALNARDVNSVVQMAIDVATANFSDSKADNYTDVSFKSSFDLAMSQRNFIRVGFDHLHGHDGRGSTDRGVLNNAVDRYWQGTPSAIYSYGAPGAQGRLEVFASQATRRYTNNRATTGGSDRDTRDIGSAFYVRAMPKTYLLAEIRRTEQDYQSNVSTLDGRENRFYLGATWVATAATSGTVKVGNLVKKFDAANRSTFKGSSWEAQATWQPRTYSKVDVYTTRQPVESTGLGNFTLSDAYGANWNHQWSSVISTDVSGRLVRDKYQNFNRDDDTSVYAAKASYKFRRWVSFSAEYTRTKRDSNLGIYDYDRDLWALSAAFSL